MFQTHSDLEGFQSSSVDYVSVSQLVATGLLSGPQHFEFKITTFYAF
jgi:hypothetical protein